MSYNDLHYQAVAGVKCIHNQNIPFGEIQPANVFTITW
jgi:hypothetical protein